LFMMGNHNINKTKEMTRMMIDLRSMKKVKGTTIETPLPSWVGEADQLARKRSLARSLLGDSGFDIRNPESAGRDHAPNHPTDDSGRSAARLIELPGGRRAVAPLPARIGSRSA